MPALEQKISTPPIKVVLSSTKPWISFSSPTLHLIARPFIESAVFCASSKFISAQTTLLAPLSLKA